MTHSVEKERENSQDSRSVVISRIWAYATGMMLISALFAGPGRDWRIILLPVTIASGAAISTITVWCIPNRWSKVTPILPEQIKELEQRIVNLETIATDDDAYWQSRIQQLEQTTTDNPMK